MPETDDSGLYPLGLSCETADINRGLRILPEVNRLVSSRLPRGASSSYSFRANRSIVDFRVSGLLTDEGRAELPGTLKALRDEVEIKYPGAFSRVWVERHPAR